MADGAFMTDGQEGKDGGRMEEGDVNALDGLLGRK